MRLQVFSVFDKAVGAYLQPFFSRAKGEAVRSFADACNKSDHQFAQHGLDYVLMYMGEFDDVSGVFVCGEPTRIIGALECAVEPFTEDTKLEDKPTGNGKVRRIPM
jgi:hypothetical protein